MRAEFAHEQAQTHLRQRNRFAVLAGMRPNVGHCGSPADSLKTDDVANQL